MSSQPLTDHFDGRQFYNLSGRKPKGLAAVFKWLRSRQRERWPTSIPNAGVQASLTPAGEEAALTFINHSTFFLQLDGMAVLTDPIYSERASPVSFVGPRRVRKPGVALEQLPKIDIVLVSHNHYDHMDLPTLRRLDTRYAPQFVTSLGVAKRLRKAGLRRVAELDWWQSGRFGALHFTATPAEHFSGRGLFDRNRTLWSGFMIEGRSARVFFAGDSAYGAHFRDIKARLGTPDVSLLPIGAYRPRWFMRDVHMDPADALVAFRDLGSRYAIGMHFGTFALADEGPYDPVEDLRRALAESRHGADTNQAQQHFRTLDFGEQWICAPERSEAQNSF